LGSPWKLSPIAAAETSLASSSLLFWSRKAISRAILCQTARRMIIRLSAVSGVFPGTSGTYTWRWGTEPDQSFRLEIEKPAVPDEGSSVTLLSIVLLCLGGLVQRRMVQHPARGLSLSLDLTRERGRTAEVSIFERHFVSASPWPSPDRFDVSVEPNCGV
jgi:hypothetical protein